MCVPDFLLQLICINLLLSFASVFISQQQRHDNANAPSPPYPCIYGLSFLGSSAAVAANRIYCESIIHTVVQGKSGGALLRWAEYERVFLTVFHCFLKFKTALQESACVCL
jgi:hypothetical protein